jgi:hypothetical protein
MSFVNKRKSFMFEKMINHKSSYFRDMSSLAIGFTNLGSKKIDYLKESIKDKHPYVRESSCFGFGLAYFKRGNKDFYNIIKPCLRDKSSPPRTGSTLSLGIGFFGKREMIKNVFPLLNSKDIDTRWGITLALGLMSINKGDENFKKYLMKSVLDRNDFVRWASSISYGFAFSGRNKGDLSLLKEKINSKDDFNKFFGLIALGLLGSGLNSKNKVISLSLLLPSLIDYVIFESFWWGLWVLGALGFYLYFN